MVERLPEIEVLLPVHEAGAMTVHWNGVLVEADEVKVEEDGSVQVVIAGVTYDAYNAEINVRHEEV